MHWGLTPVLVLHLVFQSDALPTKLCLPLVLFHHAVSVSPFIPPHPSAHFSPSLFCSTSVLRLTDDIHYITPITRLCHDYNLPTSKNRF